MNNADPNNAITLWNEAVEAEVARLAAYSPNKLPGDLRAKAIATLAEKYPAAHRAYLNAWNGRAI